MFKPARPLGDQNFVGYPANAAIEELAQSREPQQSPIPDNQRKSAFSLPAGSGRTTTRARNRRDSELVRGPARIARRWLRPEAVGGRTSESRPASNRWSGRDDQWDET
jgi:hypothetical protein